MIYQLSDEYYVRALRESDLDGSYPTWFEDQEVTQYSSHGKFFKNKDYFRSYIDGLNSETQVVWAICHRTDGHIGNICLQGISWINRHADFGMVIGDKRHWRKGVGYLAMRKLFYHGFRKLNLKRIWCAASEPNMAMRNLALKVGMLEEGRRRANLFLHGEWVDMIEYGILRHEFDCDK
jgi:ribosomal-protein-alanine N-acetyltransferase